MGPKKIREEPVDENSWRTLIEDAPLVEENWTVKVILIEAAGSDQDRIYLNRFENYAAEEKRFVVKNICKTETVFMVNQLGSEKKVKDENLRVFEEGNAYLKNKKDIPPDMFALIIKHLILKMKEEYLFIRRQRLDVREGIRRESATMVDKAEVRGTVTAAQPSAMEQAPQPKGPMQIPELPEGKKFNTALRERGEEWRDKVYVDDYPTDGPNLYVAITGFVEPFLPGCLVKIGIPLTAVVQIRIDISIKTIPTSLTRATKRGQSQTELLADQSLRFWEILQALRIQENTADDFKNTAFIVFSPPYWDTDALSGDADKIYDEICYLMYDVRDLSRQHVHYLENMDIININRDVSIPHYQRFYHELIDDLPLECVTIYSVLDSILGSVCKMQNLANTKSQSSVSTDYTVSTIRSPVDDRVKKSEDLVKEVFNTLCKTETNKKQYRLTYGQEYESHKDPIIIKYGDLAKYNTYHLGNINLDKIVFCSLLGMPVNNLWLGQNRPTGELEAKVNFHVNVLLSYFDREDVETSELNRLIHILACRKLYNNRSSLKKRHLQATTLSDFKKLYLKRSVLAEPLPTCPSINHSTSKSSFASMTKTMCESEVSNKVENDPEVERIKFLFDCPDISGLVSAAEIANNQPMKHIIDDYDYFEDFFDTTAFQIMSEAFNKFNCVDYKYCEVTDCFILMFFNSYDKEGLARDEWRCHLSTPLCLQDFFDYILEEHYDWIQSEEKIYDENVLLKAQSDSKDFNDISALKSCVEDTEVDTDLLMEGSLKHQEITKAEVNTPEPSELAVPSSKKTTVSQVTLEDKSLRSKSPTITQKTVRQSLDPRTDSTASLEIPAKPFLGYDLGDRRVEIFGKDSTFFSNDGSTISSMYSLIIPMNLEYIILNINPGNSYNNFWIHKALGELVKPEIIDTCESFRIDTKDKVMINIRKQTYEIQVPLAVSTMDANIDSKKVKSGVFSKMSMPHLTCEKKSYHSLYITWPNGIITETVHDETTSTISHIKQYNSLGPMPDLEEDMRCISLNGEVIIFKVVGDIEVLRPDGSYIKIRKYHKKPPTRHHVHDHSDDGSEKTKKSRGKASKSSSKSSRNILVDDIEDKRLEYELVIEEFEIIETNGHRKQYVHNISMETEKLLIRTATDYCLGEIFTRRMDGTSILLNKDGILVVTFPNKTRIITEYIIDSEEVYPEWTDEEKEYFCLIDSDIEMVNSKSSMSQKSFLDSDSAGSKKAEEEESKAKVKWEEGYLSIYLIYTIEHYNFSTVTINKLNEKISITSPNETIVVVDKNNHYSIQLDSVTNANFDGENLDISYEACLECRSFTTCNVIIKPSEESVTSVDNNWVNFKDSYCKKIVVNNEGNITLMDDSSSAKALQPEDTDTEYPVIADLTGLPENVISGELDVENPEDKAIDWKSETSYTSHGKCREMYLAKTRRFFVLKRDLSCSELVHRALIDRYQAACRWQPWCSINPYDTFGDNRSLVSILTPVHITETEKWLMDSKLADKPKYLTYKDLKKDSDKGFYHWMRPYDRFEAKEMKPENVLPPRLPRAFVLRTLEKQWGDPQRDELKGARELVTAILRYRCMMEADSETLLNIPIIDPRTEDERRIEDIVQSVGHKMFEQLRERLAADVQSRAKATITTSPPPPVPEEMPVEGEYLGEEMTSDMREDDESEAMLRILDQTDKMSPNLRKYWRRRAEEYKEEEFYKYLLREGVVPPYFQNVLGGAIWWEMNSMAGEAVTKAERRRMKCVCGEDSGSSTTKDVTTGYTVSGPFM